MLVVSTIRHCTGARDWREGIDEPEGERDIGPLSGFPHVRRRSGFRITRLPGPVPVSFLAWAVEGTYMGNSDFTTTYG